MRWGIGRQTSIAMATVNAVDFEWEGAVYSAPEKMSDMAAKPTRSD